MKLSPEMLASVAGIVLSLLFSYTPKLKTWFDALTGDYKRLIMLGALLVTALGVMGLSCANWYDLVTCDVAGVQKLVEIFIFAAIANQSAYMLSIKK